MAGTGKLVISDTYLKDFAQQKIQAFTDALTTNPAIRKVANFATGVPSGASGGVDPSGTYHTLLPGNSNSGMSSPSTMATNFKALTGVIQEQSHTVVASGHQMATDLINVDNVLTDAHDKAKITAPEMTADLQNLNFGGSNGPVNGGSNGPVNGGSNGPANPSPGGGSS
jgi:hypothetical protein